MGLVFGQYGLVQPTAGRSTSAFVALGVVDLDQIRCEEEERTVAPDNTGSFDSIRLQLAKQPWRATWVDCLGGGARNFYKGV